MLLHTGTIYRNEKGNRRSVVHLGLGYVSPPHPHKLSHGYAFLVPTKQEKSSRALLVKNLPKVLPFDTAPSKPGARQTPIRQDGHGWERVGGYTKKPTWLLLWLQSQHSHRISHQKEAAVWSHTLLSQCHSAHDMHKTWQQQLDHKSYSQEEHGINRKQANAWHRANRLRIPNYRTKPEKPNTKQKITLALVQRQWK